MALPRRLSFGFAALTVAGATAGGLLALPAAAAGSAPGGPGVLEAYLPADKDGFGTSRTATSRVWYTLEGGELSEVFYPQLDTPSVRDLQLVVTDGRSFTDVERTATRHRTELVDGRALVYRQTNTAKSGRYEITKTYVTDPARATVLVDLRFRSLDGRPYAVYVAYDPQLGDTGMDDIGTSAGRGLLAGDGTVGSALLAAPAFGASTNGFAGSPSDPYADLADHRLDHRYAKAVRGNVVQLARTALTGRRGGRHLTLALGFASTAESAQATARASLGHGFGPARRSYAAGWHRYLAGLAPRPASVSAYPTAYDVSVLTMAAAEDKTYPGAFVASPSMPWTWGDPATDTTVADHTGPYHLVWARDLYQIASGLLAAGDRAGARRAEHFLFARQQEADGSFPQNSQVDGTPHWTGEQLDESALPIVLAWQLGDRSATTWSHVRRAADAVVRLGPRTGQERWENQPGFSPDTLAAAIAGLVCAADLARGHGAADASARYLAIADAWERNVEAWTMTTNGPLARVPYYLRITDGQPNVGTTYDIGDSGPDAIDQRVVTDQSFLTLTRLGIRLPTDRRIRTSLQVVDRYLRAATPNGPFFHRYNLDGYGETRTGAPWVIEFDGSPRTLGRAWPILAGERGEYQLMLGRSAQPYLRAMAGSASPSYLMPEQVWDNRPPTGRPGFRSGEGTFSATPLLWTHAEFVRLARSIDAGHPVDTPSVVACRYTACP